MRLRAAFAAACALAALAPASAQVCSGISEASPGAALTSVRVATGLTRPLFAVSPPGDLDRVFLLEQDGRIRILKAGALLPTPFLDISALVRSPADGGGNEEGLLGLAFAPDFPAGGHFFVYYTNTSSNNAVVRYTVSAADPDLADPASAVPVTTISHPTNTNHNGGTIAFGPDGYLYLGTGDGGGACDTSNNAQTLTSRLGKLLRLDVDPLPYTVPPDNPFAGGPTADDDVWAYGLRNPYRWSFDRSTGDLYIGDVGQGRWEEVDWQPAPAAGKGRNFGWRNFEGSECPNASCGSNTSCSVPDNTLPVHEYASFGTGVPECSITGGYAYRGCRIPDLRGTYFYGDYCSDRIWSLVMVGGVATDHRERTAELAPGAGQAITDISSFGEDARGELFVVDLTGEVYKIVPVLSALEVSGDGAAPFLLSRDGDWSWEDLQATSSHPIAAYKVFRSDGNGSGTFDCIRQQPGTVWPGGDPQVPAEGGLFSYLVGALNASGVATSPGAASDGTPRSVSAAACP